MRLGYGREVREQAQLRTEVGDDWAGIALDDGMQYRRDLDGSGFAQAENEAGDYAAEEIELDEAHEDGPRRSEEECGFLDGRVGQAAVAEAAGPQAEQEPS